MVPPELGIQRSRCRTDSFTIDAAPKAGLASHFVGAAHPRPTEAHDRTIGR
jgi:hypothetical protein